jgi:hypothetical protein
MIRKLLIGYHCTLIENVYMVICTSPAERGSRLSESATISWITALVLRFYPATQRLPLGRYLHIN